MLMFLIGIVIAEQKLNRFLSAQYLADLSIAPLYMYTISHIESKEYDIAIFNDIFFPFQPRFTRRLHGRGGP